MRVHAAILAAGAGTRFGGDKLSEPLGGKPVWRWPHDAFAAHAGVDATFVVVPPEALDRLALQFPGVEFIAGGSNRSESAANALASCGDDAECLLIHDGARPFVSQALIGAVIEAVRRSGAAAPGLGEVDTVRLCDAGPPKLLDRTKLFRMQTPQGARVELLRRGYAAGSPNATDDMAFLEAAGIAWEMVPGEDSNFKITTRRDLERARSMTNQETRFGIGYDVHAFATDPSRPLMLGGVRFEGETGLEGHSDADVVLHAAVDALLGAAALGDIGQHFPNTDVRWSGEPSMTFLTHAGELLAKAGWAIVNLDISVIAERPKLMPRSTEIRNAIAVGLAIEVDRVSVKASTNERLGALGRGEGIAAFAVASIRAR